MARMSCSGICIRWATFFLACLIWIGGSGMLGIGIWIKTQDTEYQQLSHNLNFTAGYIAVSSFVFFLGLTGTCSILLLKRRLLKTYFVLLVILLLAETALAVFIYVEQEKMEDYIRENWNAMDDETRIWFQNKLQCCSMDPVIVSHASSDDKSCFRNDGISEGSRWEDCYSIMKNWMKTNLRMLIIGATVVGVLEIFAMAGVLRLIVLTGANDRMITQVTVAPFSGNVPHRSNRTHAPFIVLTGANDRMITQVTVAPFSGNVPHRSNRTQAPTAENVQLSDYSSSSQEQVQPIAEPEKVPLETRTNSLECWAKHCPKYNHKL